MTSKEKLASPLVFVAGQTKILPRSEGIVLVAADARAVVPIVLLLEMGQYSSMNDSSDIINAFPNRHINFKVLTPTYASLSLAKFQLIATAFVPPSASIQYGCEALSRTSRIRHYARVSILFTISLMSIGLNWWQTIKTFRQENKTRLTKNCWI